MSVYDQLQALNITLPPVAVPAAAYVPYVQTGSLVFLSGHIAKKDGKPWVGQLGRDTTTQQGQEAARAIAIDLLGTLQAACGGDLNRVRRIVVHGEATTQVLEHEQAQDCDLIVIGKRGVGLLEELLLGSVTQHVLAQSTADVLVIDGSAG